MKYISTDFILRHFDLDEIKELCMLYVRKYEFSNDIEDAVAVDKLLYTLEILESRLID